MASEKLFFIAIIPPDAIQAEITAFKEDMHTNFKSKTALKVIPHITLKAPFKLPADKKEALLDWFMNLPIHKESFTVDLKKFGSFDNKNNKVIFVNPVVTTFMAELQKSIIDNFTAAFPQIHMSTYEHQFKPHMTIAYRALHLKIMSVPGAYTGINNIMQHLLATASACFSTMG